MGNGKLTVRKVRRYRKARYPSRHSQAKRAGSLGERVLRGAAVPAVALGLGAAGGACDGGLSLSGDPDAGSDAAADVVSDVSAAEDATVNLEVLSEAVVEAEDAADAIEYPEGLNGDMPAGTYYLRFLTEAEGRAIIQETVLEADGDPSPPCVPVTLGERLVEDQPFVREGEEAVNVGVDLLADHLVLPDICPGLPDVGFEWMTEEARDEEDVTGNPAGVSSAEEASLQVLRDRHEAAISVLRAADYSYDVWEYEDGWIDDYDRARAETRLRETVREIVDDLRRNGFI